MDVHLCDGSGSDNQISTTVYADWEEGEEGEAEGFVPFNFEQARLGPWLCSFARHQFLHVTLNIPNFLICLRQQRDMLG